MSDFSAHDMISVLPTPFEDDKKKKALAASIAEKLEELYNTCDLEAIYTQIEQLPERLIDILAEDLGMKWYIANSSEEAKRAQLASCFFVHRHIGTKDTIIRALRDVFCNTEISEWFEYGGKPYHFKVTFDTSDGRSPDYTEAERLVDIFKNERSVCDYEVANSTALTLRYADFAVGVIETSQKSDTFGDMTLLTDEDGILLADTDGNILYEMGNEK